MGTRHSAPKYGMPNAVQRAIASPAIMAQVFSQLSPRWNSVRGPNKDSANYKNEDESEREDRTSCRRTLAACARVCCAFSGPALDAQWRVLDDVVDLLKILPHSVNRRVGSKDGRDMNSAQLDVLALSPDIDDSAWMKFQEFARRVRELNYGPPKCFIHPDVWNTLAARLQGTPLLPRLRRLHISMKYDDPASLVLCLSPTLRQLSFAWCDDQGPLVPTDGEFIQNIISAISSPDELSQSSSYRALENAPLPECTEPIARHLRSMGRLSQLEVLNLVPAACQIEILALRALSTLSSLRSLQLLVPRKCEDKDNPLRLEGLATIRHLHLSGTVDDIYGFLSAIPPADLRDLSLRIGGPNAHWQAIAGTFRGLKRHLPDGLESFECTFCDSIAHGPKAIMRIFYGFLKYRCLKRFSVHMLKGYGLRVFEKDLRAIASSWPNLEQFVLRCDERTTDPDMGIVMPSIAGVIELVRGCPQLHLVRLMGLDVGVLPAADTMPEEGHARMRYFDPQMLVNGEKADLDEVARVLDRLFPYLTNIPQKDVDHDPPKDMLSWTKVQESMRARRAARRLQVDVHNDPSRELRPDDALAMISLVLL